MLGVGAMLHLMGGGSRHSADEFYGSRITKAELAGNRLLLTLDDERKIAIFDDGQSCCESRYMTTDDDPSSLVGHELRRIEAKSGPTEDEEYGGAHETCFVEVGTDAGFITLTNHNEHNGYYGGFGLTIDLDGN